MIIQNMPVKLHCALWCLERRGRENGIGRGRPKDDKSMEKKNEMKWQEE
jgi:hypothetical protein